MWLGDHHGGWFLFDLSSTLRTVRHPWGGGTTHTVLTGGDGIGAVVKENTAAALAWEEGKLCAVGPGKTSSLAFHCPGYVSVEEEYLVQA